MQEYLHAPRGENAKSRNFGSAFCGLKKYISTASSGEERKGLPYRMSPLQSKNAELFVYLSWNTHAEYPLLHSDEARQAAFQAVETRARLRLCRLLAIEATPCRVHLVCRFPASLSVSHLVGIVQMACAESVCRLWEAIEPGRSLPRRLWEPACTARTLDPMTEMEARAFVWRKMKEAAQEN